MLTSDSIEIIVSAQPLVIFLLRVAMLLHFSRVAAVLAGLVAYYMAGLMYEDEEGRWQNRIEALWVAIDDRQRIVGSKTQALFDRVAEVVVSIYDRLFGPKILSWQFLGVSSSYSFAALLFGGTMIYSHYLHIDLAYNIGIIVGIFSLICAIIPSLVPYRPAIVLSLLPLTINLSSVIITYLFTHRFMGLNWELTIVGVVSSAIVLFLIRYTIRRVSERATPFRIATAIMMQLLTMGLLVYGPVLVYGADVRKPYATVPLMLDIIAVNLFTAVGASLFLLVLFAVLIHRVVWPILARLVYPLARYQLFRNKAKMASLGTACLIFALPAMPSMVKGMLQWAAK